MARLGYDLTTATPPDVVAQEGLDNIANGPVWIVSTQGNLEHVRQLSVVDNRAAIVRALAIPPREETGKYQERQRQLADGH